MKIFFKRLAVFFVVLLLVLFQVSFFSVFENGRQDFFFLFVFLLFALLLSGFRAGFAWAVVAGVLFDMFSPLAVGTIALPLVVATVGTYALFRYFVTVQTLYSILILLLATTVLFYAMLLLISWLYAWAGINDFPIHWTDLSVGALVQQFIVNGGITIVLFYAFRVLKHHFIWARHF